MFELLPYLLRSNFKTINFRKLWHEVFTCSSEIKYLGVWMVTSVLEK